MAVSARQSQPPPRTQPLDPGEPAPGFTLSSGPGSSVSLADLRGQPVVLAFYPADWSPVCSDQLAPYAAIRSEFEPYHAAVVGISVDSVWCHRAFAEARGITFPLLADFEPKGAGSRQYGAYRFGEGFSERALLVLDSQNVVAWSQVVEPEENPGADGILSALEELPARSATALASGAQRASLRDGARWAGGIMTAATPAHRLTVPVTARDHVRGDLGARFTLVE
ncbi:MAG: redoxin domain-containing protein [Acidimicrobiia bacterium]